MADDGGATLANMKRDRELFRETVLSEECFNAKRRHDSAACYLKKITGRRFNLPSRRLRF